MIIRIYEICLISARISNNYGGKCQEYVYDEVLFTDARKIRVK